MIEKILVAFTAFVITSISTLGYTGVVLVMALETAVFPLPSEVIMPFSGYLVATGRFDLQLVAIAGAVGSLAGSYVWYYLGAKGGRGFLLRYGKWALITPREIAMTDRLFERWGSHAVFLGRLLPVVRSLIAFPAGITRMNLVRFTVYTLAGSYLWCLLLAYAGMKLGQNWKALLPYLERYQEVIAVVIAIGAIAFFWRQVREIRRAPAIGDG